MAQALTFFDLGRTLLKGASGPLINEALVDAGLVPDRRVPGMGLVYRWNDLLGESLPAMALARGAALLSRGWAADAVRDAGAPLWCGGGARRRGAGRGRAAAPPPARPGDPVRPPPDRRAPQGRAPGG